MSMDKYHIPVFWALDTFVLLCSLKNRQPTVHRHLFIYIEIFFSFIWFLLVGEFSRTSTFLWTMKSISWRQLWSLWEWEGKQKSQVMVRSYWSQKCLNHREGCLIAPLLVAFEMNRNWGHLNLNDRWGNMEQRLTSRSLQTRGCGGENWGGPASLTHSGGRDIHGTLTITIT